MRGTDAGWWGADIINRRRVDALDLAVRRRTALIVFDNHGVLAPLSLDARLSGVFEQTLYDVLNLARLLPVAILSGETTENLRRMLHTPMNQWPWIEPRSQLAERIELVGLHGAQWQHGDARHTHPGAVPYRDRMHDAYVRVSNGFDDLGLNDNMVYLEDKDGLAVGVRYRPLVYAARWTDRFRPTAFDMSDPDLLPDYPEWFDAWKLQRSIHKAGLASIVDLMQQIAAELTLGWSRRATSAEISCPGFHKGRAIKELVWRAREANPGIDSVAYFGDGTVDLDAREGLLELQDGWGFKVLFGVVVTRDTSVDVIRAADIVFRSQPALDELLDHWVRSLLHEEQRRTAHREPMRNKPTTSGHRPVGPEHPRREDDDIALRDEPPGPPPGRPGTPSASLEPDDGLTR